MKIRIGTRGSQLALWQANETARLLAEQGHESELVIIKTTGDKRTDVPLSAIGGKGLFVKEIEDALSSGTIDIAVHSLKDVPSEIPEQFELAGFLKRADPRDAWLHPEGKTIEMLPAGATVATSSPRRKAQVIGRYPHLNVVSVRGNVDTRINKLRARDFDGLLLASAGLNRLGRASDITAFFPTDQMVPCAGQGIVAIEIARHRRELVPVIQSITHQPSQIAALTERGVLQKFGTLLDCYSAIAVHATLDGERIAVHAFLSDFEGTRSIKAAGEGTIEEREKVIDSVHRSLVEQGAHELLRMDATK